MVVCVTLCVCARAFAVHECVHNFIYRDVEVINLCVCVRVCMRVCSCART